MSSSAKQEGKRSRTTKTSKASQRNNGTGNRLTVEQEKGRRHRRSKSTDFQSKSTKSKIRPSSARYGDDGDIMRSKSTIKKNRLNVKTEKRGKHTRTKSADFQSKTRNKTRRPRSARHGTAEMEVDGVSMTDRMEIVDCVLCLHKPFQHKMRRKNAEWKPFVHGTMKEFMAHLKETHPKKGFNPLHFNVIGLLDGTGNYRYFIMRKGEDSNDSKALEAMSILSKYPYPVSGALKKHLHCKERRFAKPSSRHKNPMQIANLCDQSVLKTLGQKEEHLSLIRNVLLENDCDSFTLKMFDAEKFTNIVGKCMTKSKKQIKALSLELNQLMKHTDFDWSHISAAVSHEMTDKLGDLIAFVTEKQFSTKIDSEDASKALDFAIATRGKRTLLLAESQYLTGLLHRACNPLEGWHVAALEKDIANLQHDTKWPGLNREMMVDVYDTHKVFMFGAFNCTIYSIKNFRDDIRFAESNILGIGDSTYSRIINATNFKGATALFPKYLIGDDLFQIVNALSGVTQWINNCINQKQLQKTGQKVFCCVIPEKVVSLYDNTLVYTHSFDDVEEWLTSHFKDVLYCKTFLNISDAPDRIAARIEECHNTIISSLDPQQLLVMVFDRRACAQSGTVLLVMFQCQNMKDVTELTTNHYLGMSFSTEGTTESVLTRGWLHYGYGNRQRFWPEQLIWFIPRLFLKKKAENGTAFVKRLYSSDYKHGFCLNLSDPVFERYYKILTKWTHRSVNYRRKKGINKEHFGLRDHIERTLIGNQLINLHSFLIANDYSSDDILDDVSGDRGDSNLTNVFDAEIGEWNALRDLVQKYKRNADEVCTIDNVSELWDCHYVKEMVDALTSFQNENFQVDATNVWAFNHSAIIRGLDHLTKVHNLFSIENKHTIRHYFGDRVRCVKGEECEALIHHCSRRRENEDEYLEQKEDEVDSIVTVTAGCLSSAHCYLLHSDETLYRMSGMGNAIELNPFSTPVNEGHDEEKKEDGEEAPLSIDFGVHILQWLPFGVLPRFKSFEEEMIQNPASTLSQDLFDEYTTICVAKIGGKQWAEYTLDELLCLKFYTDCTKLQNLFRRAHWESVDLETKRAFYHWANTMYATFLFHAQPVNAMVHHGLNRLFQVDQIAPTYQGPFSTTTSRGVAHGFADGKGLMFSMKGSYVNPIRNIIGIPMVHISCFKNEAEILLYSQTLPIAKTETFDDSDATMVNHLMHSLKSNEKRITDSDEYLRKIGVKPKGCWIPLIWSHPLLMRESAFRGDTVLARLSKMKHFSICLTMIRLRFFDFVICDGTKLMLPEQSYIPARVSRLLPYCAFGVSFGENPPKKEYKFKRLRKFAIPIKPPTANDLFNITLWAKPRDNSIDFGIIGKCLLSRYGLDQDGPLQINSELVVPTFDHKLFVGGSLRIRCHSEIDIGRGAVLSANESGVDQVHYHSLKQALGKIFDDIENLQDRSTSLSEKQCVLRFGRFYGVKGISSITGRGGGTISLISNALVKNNGTLTANGSAGGHCGGGTIFISTESEFINEGAIECRPKGRICIRCSAFYNGGMIESVPEVFITEKHTAKTTESVPKVFETKKFSIFKASYPLSLAARVKLCFEDAIKQTELSLDRDAKEWYRFIDEVNKKNKLKNKKAAMERAVDIIGVEKFQFVELKLSVHAYRSASRHPRNLLDGKGTRTSYYSRSGAGDWIIFEIENASNVIPKMVIIRNYDVDWTHWSDEYCGLKSIELSVAENGNGKYKRLAVIEGIHKKDSDPQYFYLDHDEMENIEQDSSGNNRFIKLKVLRNWEDDTLRSYSTAAKNCFHSLIMLGFESKIRDDLDLGECVKTGKTHPCLIGDEPLRSMLSLNE